MDKQIKYYHGSGELFNGFLKSKVGQNYRESERAGFFFSKKQRTAQNYAFLATGGENPGYVYEAVLSVTNPVRRKTNSEYYSPPDVFDIRSDELLREAFLERKDGIFIEGTMNDDLMVAFNPEQIKVLRILHGNEVVYDHERPLPIKDNPKSEAVETDIIEHNNRPRIR